MVFWNIHKMIQDLIRLISTYDYDIALALVPAIPLARQLYTLEFLNHCINKQNEAVALKVAKKLYPFTEKEVEDVLLLSVYNVTTNITHYFLDTYVFSPATLELAIIQASRIHDFECIECILKVAGAQICLDRALREAMFRLDTIIFERLFEHLAQHGIVAFI